MEADLASAPAIEAHPHLAEARLVGLMLNRHAGGWQAEVELLHHGVLVTAVFDGISHCFLTGMPAVGEDQVAFVQVRPVPVSMRRDLASDDGRVAARFEFASGTSLLVVCDACRLSPAP